jgi:hypothetical protein
MKRMDLDSGMTNLTSLRTSFARELQPKQKAGLESKKYTHARPNRHDCRGNTHHASFGAHLFSPCIITYGCSLERWLKHVDLRIIYFELSKLAQDRPKRRALITAT